MANGLKVIHVVLSLDCGGLEHVVLDLVREGRRLGHNSTVLCLERPGVLAPRAAELGVRLLCLNKAPGLRLGLIAPLTLAIGEVGADIVHSHQIGALFYAGPAARAAGIPVVVHTEHGKHCAGIRTRWLGWLACRWADRFFAVSRDIATEVTRARIVSRRRVEVIPNGIDVSRFEGPTGAAAVRDSLGIPKDVLLVGTVGRLTEVKNQELLLRVFAALRARMPEAHLLLVGDGPLRELLLGRAAELNLSGFVHFAGYQSDPVPYLQAMDVFALTSHSEGMPLVILEAWAAGVPVVSTRVGGIPEMLEEGLTGVLVPPGDEPALVSALEHLLLERDRARQFREAGFRCVRSRYALRVMAENYERNYRQLLARKAGVVACAC